MKMPNPVTKATAVQSFVLQRPGAPRVEILDLGGTINSVRLVPDDPATEVSLRFDGDAAREHARYASTLIGRYANRIRGGKFPLNGVEHVITTNENGNSLHGGATGFDQAVWRVEEQSDDAILLSHVSPDGDQGFPGEVTATARYELIDAGLALTLTASSTADTFCALTSHAYWDLSSGRGIEGQLLTIDADEYCPIGPDLLPIQGSQPVDGTGLDLREATPIRDVVRRVDDQIGLAGGVDHAFAIRGEGMRRHVRLEEPQSGRVMEVWSDAPASQVYTGNMLDGSWIANGHRLRQRDAIAIEPAVYPDAPNQAWAADALLRAGETAARRIEWRFD